MNNNITYIDLDHTWTTSAGTLNMNLYYKDNLHLIEKGNEKLANAITTAFNVGDGGAQSSSKIFKKSASISNKKARNISRNATKTNKETASSNEKSSKIIKKNDKSKYPNTSYIKKNVNSFKKKSRNIRKDNNNANNIKTNN